MAKLGKWIGGGLGWAFGGPIGALLGFAIGTFVDNADRLTGTAVTTPVDFRVSLMVLVAAVMKADGKVLKSELEYVRNFLVHSFGDEEARNMIELLRQLLEKDIPVEQVGTQIKNRMDYASRLQLLHILYGISHADGEIHPLEIRIIERIAIVIGINTKDRLSIKAMFVEDYDSAYKILEIGHGATDEEIKHAYRKMAIKYHPDKVAHLGEEIQREANIKFRKVNEAYERIKKERRMI